MVINYLLVWHIIKLSFLMQDLAFAYIFFNNTENLTINIMWQ